MYYTPLDLLPIKHVKTLLIQNSTRPGKTIWKTGDNGDNINTFAGASQ